MSTYVLSQNPTTIISSISVTGTAIYGGSGTSWDVINLSNVTATGTGGIGILLESGGTIANGSSTDTTALIDGAGHAAIEIAGTAGTVMNYGTITDPGGSVTFGDGIYLKHGGNITNGSIADTAALISGDGGLGMGVGGTFYTTILVTNAAGNVTNFATIAPTSNSLGEDIILEDGGTVVNGPSGATGALITGLIGVGIAGGTGTVTNFGTIHTKSDFFEGGTGVELGDGGSVTNGTAVDTNVFIGGYILNVTNFHAGIEHGVAIGGGAGTVTNFGTITGATLNDGGQIVNGPSGATGALIDSYYAAAAIKGSLGSVTNFGTIVGYTDGFGAIGVGVYLDFSGSSVMNGASNATTALIKAVGSGAIGVDLAASGTVTNFGTITGPLGISLAAGGTVIDAGTITGSGGTAVSFGGTGASRLVLDPGYKLVGVVLGSTTAGATNTLELAAGTIAGSLSGLGTEFLNFGTVTVDAGANWTLAGANTIGNGGALIDLGNLVVAAAGTVAGVLTVEEGGSAEFKGAVGNGTTIGFGAGGALVIDELATNPGGVQTQEFNAPITGLIDGDKIRIATAHLGNFAGIDAATPGAFNSGSDTTPLVLTSGGATVATLTLDGNYQGDAFGVSAPSGGFMTIGMQLSPDDFSGIGQSDILWRNTSGEVDVWNSTPDSGGLSFAPQDLGPVTTDWGVSGTGDFNGDGRTDILWRNTNGEVDLWDSTSGNTASFTYQDLGAVTTDWTVAATKDFNGDGKADILWRNTDGDVELWNSISGSTVSFSYQDFGVVTTDWSVAATGDFNGDGKADILWRNTNGDLYLWDSNPGNGVSFSYQDLGIVPTAWSVAATGDFNGDGKTDILWRNANGEVDLWDSNPGSTASFSYQDLGNVATAWNIIGTGDFNGDGKSDILWQYENGASPSDPNNGEAAVWLMNGATLTSATVIGQPPSSWHIVT